jgi:flagellar hook-basal body complex protein FliE
MNDLRIENLHHTSTTGPEKKSQDGSGDFAKIIKGAINNANSLERDANKSIVDLLQGKADVHEAMIALQKTDVTMRLLLTIRNKVIEAYREIMHMQF